MNQYRIKKIGLEEQFICAYGGLRGAVAFSLVTMLDEDMPNRSVLVTATLVVILFTVFIQGITIRPLVHLLNIQKRGSGKNNLSEEINGTTMDHIMAGIEEILGHYGDFYLRELIRHYNDKYFKKWFTKAACDTPLTRLFEKITLSEHYAHLYGPVALIEDKVKPLVSKKRELSTRSSTIGTPLCDEVILNPVSHLALTPVEEPEPSEDVPPGGAPLRKKSIRKSYIPIRSRRVSVREESPTPSVESDDTQVLRKAFKENPYNKNAMSYTGRVGWPDQILPGALVSSTTNITETSSMKRTKKYPNTYTGGTSMPRE